MFPNKTTQIGHIFSKNKVGMSTSKLSKMSAIKVELLVSKITSKIFGKFTKHYPFQTRKILGNFPSFSPDYDGHFPINISEILLGKYSSTGKKYSTIFREFSELLFAGFVNNQFLYYLVL